MTKPWMIDELAHAGPEHLDPGFVTGFDRKQGYPDPVADLAVLRELGIGAASTVVDLRTEFSTFRWLFEPMLTAAGSAS
jgi:hypothetical protein